MNTILLKGIKMPPDHLSIEHLVNDYELQKNQVTDKGIRVPFSLRITAYHSAAIDFLAERWEMSRAAVATKVLEAALNHMLEIDPMQPPVTPSDHLAVDFRAWYENSDDDE